MAQATNELTPMRRQYQQIKEQHKDCILMFRLGDFYEMFDEDAKLTARELDLTLTTRDRGKPKEEQTPMCGVPYHSVDSYIARLVQKGYKVAICEQMEDPALAKGLVKRAVTRIITPGTVTESCMLDESKNNYIGCIYGESGKFGLAFCDVSTGAFFTTVCSDAQNVASELGRFAPSEILRYGSNVDCEVIEDAVFRRLSCCVSEGKQELFALESAESLLEDHFHATLSQMGIAGMPAAVIASGALLQTLLTLQKNDLAHIRELQYYTTGRFMELDLAARRNLELTETLRSKEKKGSLLWVLDKTKTPMGGRMLRSWLERPLLSVTDIDRRSSAVAALVDDTIRREELIAGMTGLGDMERLIGRIVYGTAGGRDLTSLRAAMEKLPNLKEQLSGFSDRRLTELTAELDTLDDISGDIAAAICDEPPFSVREGNIIRDGYNEEVDRLRHILKNGKGVMAEMEAKEKEKTGIRTLKIGYNKVFGYYIEVSNAFKEQVPETYIRKQTLVNGERFITQELKDLEHEILTASERVVALEYELFSALRQQIADNAGRIQKTAAAVAECDALCSFASVAVHNNFCRPEVDESGVIEIREGRHPVVEKVLKDSLFVPNDTFMGEKEERVAIITGPNMAGKSTYMRQVALIVLMAQMGSFVPAKYAHIGVVDRIFTRIGASDDLSAGQSTFMVEMTEVSDILHQATKNSLLILDEIGRGTSTFDGMAIARAVLEYCADKKTLGAKTLFATHYHELTVMENELECVKNYNIAVKKRGDDITFLRRIVRGGADDSFGIEVAKLAGVPDKVVRRAKEVLKSLESGEMVKKPKNAVKVQQEEPIQLTVLTKDTEVLNRLKSLDVNTLTPIESMNILFELANMLK